MKVTLRNSYSYNTVVVVPELSSYDSDMTIELDTKDVLEILKIQVEMEVLQQRLMPLYKACDEARQARYAAEKAAKEAEEAAQNQGYVGVLVVND